MVDPVSVCLDSVCVDAVCLGLSIWTLSVCTLSVWILSVWTLSVRILSVRTLSVWALSWCQIQSGFRHKNGHIRYKGLVSRQHHPLCKVARASKTEENHRTPDKNYGKQGKPKIARVPWARVV